MHPTWQSFLKAQSAQDRASGDADTSGATLPQDYCAALVDLAVMRLKGADAANFMQGYFTADLDDLSETRAAFGAYCDIKGRVVADMIALADPTGLLLVTHHSLVEPVRQSLQKYLMFSTSELSEANEDWLTLGLLGRNATGSDLSVPAWTLDRADGLWQIAAPGDTRWLCLARVDEAERIWASFGGRSGNADPWHLADIDAGLAHLEAATSAGFLPQMLGYDALDAISFTKGCYLGQEVVTRAQNRGQVKRRLGCWEWTNASGETPAAGAELTSDDGRRVGTVIQSAATSPSEGKLLAVVAKAAGADPLHAGSRVLQPHEHGP